MQLFFQPFPIIDFNKDRPLIIKENSIEFYTFSGTQINKTISFLLNNVGISNKLFDKECFIEITSPLKGADSIIDALHKAIVNIEQFVEKVIKETPKQFPFSKWGEFLPADLKKSYILETYFDIAGTEEFLNTVRIAGGE